MKRGASGCDFLLFLERPVSTPEVPVVAAEVAMNRLKLVMAFSWAVNGVSSAGKARRAACSCAAVIGEAKLPSFDLSVALSLTLSRIDDFDRAVVVDAWVVSTFVDVATNASAAAAAKNTQPALKRRYVKIRL